MKGIFKNWFSLFACLVIILVVGVSVSGALGKDSVTAPAVTSVAPSVTASLEENSEHIYSEDEGLAELKKLKVCQDEDIRFLNREKVLNEDRYEYKSNQGSYLFDPSRGVLLGVIKLEYNMTDKNISDESSISRAKEFISAYFPDVDLSKMELTINELKDHGSYQDRGIEFRKFMDGVDTGNSIMTWLTPGGDLISITICYNDVRALQQQVNLDAGKAKEIAYSKVKEDMVKNGRESFIKDASDYEYEIEKTVFRDNLVWLVRVKGVSLFGSGDEENRDSTYTVIISCVSGEVVLFDSTF